MMLGVRYGRRFLVLYFLEVWFHPEEALGMIMRAQWVTGIDDGTTIQLDKNKRSDQNHKARDVADQLGGNRYLNVDWN